MQGLLVLLLILALTAALLLLLSERNQRRYFLEVQGRLVVIDRGLALPYGHAPYHPADTAGARAYRPFELPAEIALPGEEAFDDRPELDRRWADLLLQAAKARLDGVDPAHLEQGMDLLGQVDALRELTAEQQHQARQLRSEVAFAEATDELARALAALRETQGLLRLGSESSRGHAKDSADLLDRLSPAIDQLQRAARSEGVMPAERGDLPAADAGSLAGVALDAGR
jgi:hypothetical protein